MIPANSGPTVGPEEAHLIFRAAQNGGTVARDYAVGFLRDPMSYLLDWGVFETTDQNFRLTDAGVRIAVDRGWTVTR